MARIAETLRYFFVDGVIRMPNVVDNSSKRYSMLMQALDFFNEIAERHGSSRLTEGDHTFWEAQFAEHEAKVVERWFSWHSQYERVESLDLLWVLPADTGTECASVQRAHDAAQQTNARG
jgi:hypothetical protein